MAKANEQWKGGKPRLLVVTPDNIDALQAKSGSPGKRFDVYLGEEAQVAVSVLMLQHNWSASRVIDTLIRCAANLPLRDMNKWFPEKK